MDKSNSWGDVSFGRGPRLTPEERLRAQISTELKAKWIKRAKDVLAGIGAYCLFAFAMGWIR